jgi:hypothetical protein
MTAIATRLMQLLDDAAERFINAVENELEKHWIEEDQLRVEDSRELG